MSKKKSIKFNAVLNGTLTVLNMVFPLITFPYISRVLAVDEIGKYNFSASIISYFSLIAALGIDKYAVREGAKYRDNRLEISDFASKVFSLHIVTSLISYILLFGTLAVVQKLHSYTACILIFSLEIFFGTLGTGWLYSVFEDYVYITVRSIAFKILSVVLLFAFVRNEGDYLKYTAITVFASVGSSVLNFLHARKYCDIRFTLNFDWKEILKPVLILFASNIAIKIYVNLDVAMLGFLKDDSVVAIYSVATKIYGIVRSVLQAALMVAIPRMAFYVGKKMQNEYNALFQKISNSLLTVTIPAMAGIIILRTNVVRIIAGDKFLNSSTSLYILSFAIIFGSFSTLFNQCALIPYRREKFMLRNSVISSVINLALNFVFIPFFAEVGAAITTLISEFTSASLNFWACKDILRDIVFDKKNTKNLFSIFIGTGAIILVCLIICSFIENMWLQTCACIGVSVVVYWIILTVLKNPVVYSINHMLKISKHN